MQSKTYSESSRPPSPPTKPNTSSTSEMLTPSEIESLRQGGREASAYAQKVFRKEGGVPPGRHERRPTGRRF
jgi:hypothetical protein